MDNIFGIGGFFLLIFWVFVVVLVLLWLVLPFAIFGIKSRLERIEMQSGETNRLLGEILKFQNSILTELRTRGGYNGQSGS